MRIKGLVTAFNHIRSQLQVGINPDQVEQFREQVKTIVREVEEICREHRTTPGRLPAPSRMAYVFLKELDLDNLPLNDSNEILPENGPNLRVRNVVRIGEQIADKIWQRHGLLRARNEIDMIRREIDQHAASIEQICQDHRATPSALEMRSRQTYCWLKFLAGGDNLTSHLETLERVRKLIGEHRLPPSRPVHLHLIVMAALWRRREYQNALVIKVNMGYSYADQNLWRALIHNAVAERTAVNDNLVSEYAASDDFCELLFEIESLASPLSLPAKGRAHDLDESFERVNRGYFDGRMEKPKIVWNRTLTMRKFGHYQPGRDQLMLSLSLDDDKVAAYVIDFVMYHELLHKKHGSTAVNGRRQAHSPAFRADERRFAQFAEATYNLHQLALKHRRQ